MASTHGMTLAGLLALQQAGLTCPQLPDQWPVSVNTYSWGKDAHGANICASGAHSGLLLLLSPTELADHELGYEPCPFCTITWAPASAHRWLACFAVLGTALEDVRRLRTECAASAGWRDIARLRIALARLSGELPDILTGLDPADQAYAATATRAAIASARATADASHAYQVEEALPGMWTFDDSAATAEAEVAARSWVLAHALAGHLRRLDSTVPLRERGLLLPGLPDSATAAERAEFAETLSRFAVDMVSVDPSGEQSSHWDALAAQLRSWASAEVTQLVLWSASALSPVMHPNVTTDRDADLIGGCVRDLRPVRTSLGWYVTGVTDEKTAALLSLDPDSEVLHLGTTDAGLLPEVVDLAARLALEPGAVPGGALAAAAGILLAAG
jgi:hypothetical protein